MQIASEFVYVYARDPLESRPPADCPADPHLTVP
jgi:hypothetical protein